MEVVRLGEGVDRTGLLSPAAIERTRVALEGYARRIEQHGAERVRMVATSASRDAGNRDDFVRMVQATLGADPEVITGHEEAALSFAGAIAGLPSHRRPRAADRHRRRLDRAGARPDGRRARRQRAGRAQHGRRVRAV